MCSEASVLHSKEELLEAVDLDFSIADILYYILKLHISGTKRVYEQSPEASKAFNILFYKNQLQVAATNNNHTDH